MKKIYGTSAKLILVQTKPDSTGLCSIHKFIYDPKHEDSIILKGSEVIETDDGEFLGINGFGIFTHKMIQYFAWNSVTKVEIYNEDHIVEMLRDKDEEENKN